MDRITPPIATGNIYRVSRELKREQNSLFNCMSSIIDDAAFCNEIRVLYPDLPLLANLRCGLWYAPKPDGTCYFKSTDGHQGNHQFSTTRLNWHVAELAACRGGCLIVDATRKGKRFPDAMSKTIPVWCAVLNRAIARVRLHDAQKERRRRLYMSQDGQVFTAVADTQTSISVREDSSAVSSSIDSQQSCLTAAPAACCASAGSAAANSLQQKQPGMDSRTQQPHSQHVQQQAASAIVSDRLQKADDSIQQLMADSMASSVELLSGLALAPAVAAAPSAAGAPTGCLPGSPRACSLQRSCSLHIATQPSLQEWLDETELLQRLKLSLEGRSPIKRIPRSSCHNIVSDERAAMADGCVCAAASQYLVVSSAPASSCLQVMLPILHNKSSLPLYKDVPGGLRVQCPAPAAADGSQLSANCIIQSGECPGFLLADGPEQEPVTPRLGCSVPHSAACAAKGVPQKARARTAPSAAASNSGSELTSQHLLLLEQQQWQQQFTAAVPAGPYTVGSAVSVHSGDELNTGATCDAAGDFAFPLPHPLAQSADSLHSDAGPVSALRPGSAGSSSCSSSLALPDMPVVVLNGTSHQPEDAASILDIWRSMDLEDVATLPGISDFLPGVYHVAQHDERESAAEEQPQCPTQQKQWCDQQLQSGMDECIQQLCDCTNLGHCPAAAAGGVDTGSPAGSSKYWLDKEPALAWDSLCGYAPAAVASGAACSSCSSSGSTDARAHIRPAAGAAADAATEGCNSEWDTSLHLPLWVCENERQQIESKLDGWVERLLAVGADVRRLAAVLKKPLRPLWVSQRSIIWTNQVAHPGTLPFTPLLLVSASQPEQCERQAAKMWQLPTSGSACLSNNFSGVSALNGSGSVYSDGDSDADSDIGSPRLWGRCPKGNPSSSKANRRHKKHINGLTAADGGLEDSQQMSSWSYAYVPGAGDDEESWACGLTPSLFWDNCAPLMSCAPAGIYAAVCSLVQQHKAVAVMQATSAAIHTPHSSSTSSWPLNQQDTGQQQQRQQHSRLSRLAAPPVLTDKHHPAPHGCGGVDGSLLGSIVPGGWRLSPAAPGASWVGSTGLALGNLQDATAADVWGAFDAVLCCGNAVAAVLQQEYQAHERSMASQAAAPPKIHAATFLFSNSTPAQCCSRAGPLSKANQCLYDNSHYCTTALGSSCDSSSTAQHVGAWQQPCMASSVHDKEAISIEAPLAVTKPARRKGGMLSELLGQQKVAKPAAETPATGKNCLAIPAVPGTVHQWAEGDSNLVGFRHNSSDSNSNCSSGGGCASDSTSSSNGGSCDSTGSHTACAGAAMCRLKWVRMQDAKKDRVSLKHQLQEALEFVSGHLAAGHLVLLHDDEGHDKCVCVAVATLLGCFSPPDGLAAAVAPITPSSPAATAAAAAEPRFLAAWHATSGYVRWRQQQQRCLPAEPVSKHSVRQRLALVSSCYPAARPTRALLKQVYNFFEERRRASSA